uniref:Protein PHYTOCHROME KINASE SUBSTRATE 4 n=1 Tax=Leersia perrieri TaxID=77586 RepID=A0A0D9UZC3_9ORYZ
MDRYRAAPRPVYLAAGDDDVPARRQLPLQPRAGASARRSGAVAELDIFSAERYFNADDVIKKKHDDDALAVVVAATPAPPPEMVDAASQSGRTVASSSEASWNSRSGLLSSHVTTVKTGGSANGVAVAAGGGKKSGQRWGIFSRDCPCAGRKAVTVDVASEPRSPATPRTTHSRFDNSHVIADGAIFKAKSPLPAACEMKISPGNSSAFPPLATKIFAAPPGIGRRVVVSSGGGGFTFPVSAVVDEPPRESLEVFRPIDEESVLADPPAEHLAGGLAVAGGGGGFGRGAAAVEEEAMSDASSDLFDLESFAAASSYPTTSYRGGGRGSRRNSREYYNDDLPYGAAAAAAVEPALSECMYAPSEVSVVWSVATAEGGGGAFDAASAANFSSAASACCVEEFTFAAPESGAAAAGHDGFTAAMSRSAGRKKGGGGFLNSCRCEKAVSVGPTPVRVVRPATEVMNGGKGGGGGGGVHAMGLAGGGAARFHAGRVHMPVRT